MKNKISKLPFLDIYFFKISTSIFWWNGHSSWSTFGLCLVRDPKGSKTHFFEPLDHGNVIMKKDHPKWDNFVVHGVNNP